MCTTARRALAVGLALASIPVWAQGSRVTVVSKQGLDTLRPVQVRAWSVSDSPVGRVAERTFDSRTDAPFEIELPAGLWTMRASAPGAWSAETTVWIPENGTELTLELWPVGTLTGLLEPEKADRFAGPLIARLESSAAPAGSPSRAQEVACFLEQVGQRFRCEVPVGQWDVRLSSRGYISRLFFDIEIMRGTSKEVGPVPWRVGTSLVGRVEVPRGAGLSASARVRIEPAGALGENRTSAALEVRVSPRGHFQFDGVAPGGYWIQAVQGESRSARVPVEIVEGREARLRQPLQLLPASVLKVQVHPPAAPDGSLWSIFLFEGREGFSRLAEPTIRPAREGVATFAGESSGWHLIQVCDSSGNPWWTDSVDLLPGPQTLVADLDLLWIEGALSIGDQPLQAELAFGGEYGAERILLESDEDGRFAGHLPREGEWEILVRSQNPATQRQVVRRIEPLPGSHVARLEISIPDTRVEVLVRDERGRPAPASVDVKSLELGIERTQQLETDEDAIATFRGLPRGRAIARAWSRGKRSEPLEFEIPDDHSTRKIELVLKEWRELSGVVSSVSGPVAGGYLTLQPLSSVVSFGVGKIRIEVDGSFREWLPAGESEFVFTLAVPGFAMRSGRLRLPAEGPLHLSVDQAGGELSLRLPPANEGELPHFDWYVFHRGALVLAGELRRWATFLGTPQSDPERFLVPAMEAGEYTFCRPADERPWGGTFGARPEPGWSCVTDWLPPMGRLEVSIPGS